MALGSSCVGCIPKRPFTPPKAAKGGSSLAVPHNWLVGSTIGRPAEPNCAFVPGSIDRQFFSTSPLCMPGPGVPLIWKPVDAPGGRTSELSMQPVNWVLGSSMQAQGSLVCVEEILDITALNLSSRNSPPAKVFVPVFWTTTVNVQGPVSRQVPGLPGV